MTLRDLGIYFPCVSRGVEYLDAMGIPEATVDLMELADLTPLIAHHYFPFHVLDKLLLIIISLQLTILQPAQAHWVCFLEVQQLVSLREQEALYYQANMIHILR